MVDRNVSSDVCVRLKKELSVAKRKKRDALHYKMRSPSQGTGVIGTMPFNLSLPKAKIIDKKKGGEMEHEEVLEKCWNTLELSCDEIGKGASVDQDTSKGLGNLNTQRARFNSLVRRLVTMSNENGAEFLLFYRFPNMKCWTCGVKSFDPASDIAGGPSKNRAKRFSEDPSVISTTKKWLTETTQLQAIRSGTIKIPEASTTSSGPLNRIPKKSSRRIRQSNQNTIAESYIPSTRKVHQSTLTTSQKPSSETTSTLGASPEPADAPTHPHVSH